MPLRRRCAATAICPGAPPRPCSNCCPRAAPDMHPPAFWRSGGGTLLPFLLSPVATVVAAVTAGRLARPGWRAPVPVICCGNLTVGGAGKTTVALDLGARLIARGRAVHYLLRGYGGVVRGPPPRRGKKTPGGGGGAGVVAGGGGAPP